MSVKLVLPERDASFTAAFDAVCRQLASGPFAPLFRRREKTRIMERWIGSCWRELLDRTLTWNQRRLTTVLREYANCYNTHRPHRTLKQAALLRPLPDGVTDLNRFRVSVATTTET
jgi:putative transposase